MELSFQHISAQYQVRRLTEADLPELLALAKDNPTYYRYMGEEPTLEGLRGDLTKLPPRTTSEDKYFLGYFRDGRLWGALDLILHFPSQETAHRNRDRWGRLYHCCHAAGAVIIRKEKGDHYGKSNL